MALLLLSLLCLVQSEATASATAASGGASITAARQGDVVALRDKARPLEIRCVRTLPVKFVSGNPGALPPESAFFLPNRVSPIREPAVPASVLVAQSSANQPRAPPAI